MTNHTHDGPNGRWEAPTMTETTPMLPLTMPMTLPPQEHTDAELRLMRLERRVATLTEMVIDMKGGPFAGPSEGADGERREPPAKPEKKSIDYPQRLSRPCQEALVIVLENIRRDNRQDVTLEQVVDEVNQVRPGVMTRGGKTNDSIRAFISQRAGLMQRWTEERRPRTPAPAAPLPSGTA